MAKRKISTNLLQTLEDLGLSGSEAAVYAHLLAHSPATGYRVAQAIGKPVANTYKTIASLEERGAVIVDDSGTRLCRAVPADEFLARLEKQFQERRAKAARAAAEVGVEEKGVPDPRVYQLTSRRQVIERARAMLARATRCALVDVFPRPLEELAPDLDRAAARGIDVVVKAYADPPFKRATAIPILTVERDIPARWPGDHLNIVVDANEALVALLERDGDGVVQAVSTSSPYLCAIQHSGLQFEFMMTHVRDGIYRALDVGALHNIVISYIRFSLHQMPGYKTLLTGHRTVDDSTDQQGTGTGGKGGARVATR